VHAPDQLYVDELELLLFRFADPDGETLARRLLAADPDFTASLVARLVREPIVLH
jgi:hypothetical protein